MFYFLRNIEVNLIFTFTLCRNSLILHPILYYVIILISNFLWKSFYIGCILEVFFFFDIRHSTSHCRLFFFSRYKLRHSNILKLVRVQRCRPLKSAEEWKMSSTECFRCCSRNGLFQDKTSLLCIIEPSRTFLFNGATGYTLTSWSTNCDSFKKLGL